MKTIPPDLIETIVAAQYNLTPEISVELSVHEVMVLREARAICEKANTIITNGDTDEITSYGEAELALMEILNDYPEVAK